MVAAVDITDSFRLFLSRQEPLRLFPSMPLSGGLLEADVAIANAAAAVEVLHLDTWKVRLVISLGFTFLFVHDASIVLIFSHFYDYSYE